MCSAFVAGAVAFGGCSAGGGEERLSAEAEALERERQRVMRNLAELDREMTQREAADRDDPQAVLDASVRRQGVPLRPPLRPAEPAPPPAIEESND